MEAVLKILASAGKPDPPEQDKYESCEVCGSLTNNSSLAWPKESYYRFVCLECKRKRFEEQQRTRNAILETLTRQIESNVL